MKYMRRIPGSMLATKHRRNSERSWTRGAAIKQEVREAELGDDAKDGMVGPSRLTTISQSMKANRRFQKNEVNS